MSQYVCTASSVARTTHVQFSKQLCSGTNTEGTNTSLGLADAHVAMNKQIVIVIVTPKAQTLRAQTLKAQTLNACAVACLCLLYLQTYQYLQLFYLLLMWNRNWVFCPHTYKVNVGPSQDVIRTLRRFAGHSPTLGTGESARTCGIQGEFYGSCPCPCPCPCCAWVGRAAAGGEDEGEWSHSRLPTRCTTMNESCR